jgi:hypothetical protein
MKPHEHKSRLVELRLPLAQKIAEDDRLNPL